MVRQSLLDPLGPDKLSRWSSGSRASWARKRRPRLRARADESGAAAASTSCCSGIGPDGHTALAVPDQPSLRRELATGGRGAAGRAGAVRAAHIDDALHASGSDRRRGVLVSGAPRRTPSPPPSARMRSPSPRPVVAARALRDNVTVLLDPAAPPCAPMTLLGVDLGGTKVAVRNAARARRCPAVRSLDPQTCRAAGADRRSLCRWSPGASEDLEAWESASRRSSSRHRPGRFLGQHAATPTCPCARSCESGRRAGVRRQRRDRAALAEAHDEDLRLGGPRPGDDHRRHRGRAAGWCSAAESTRRHRRRRELGHTHRGAGPRGRVSPSRWRFPQPGSLEFVASGARSGPACPGGGRGCARTRRSGGCAAGKPVLGPDAVAAARAATMAAADVRTWGERLGIGIANAINTFDPQEVVIGGGGAQAGELLLRTPSAWRADRSFPGSAASAPRSGSPGTACAPACSVRRCWPSTSSERVAGLVRSQGGGRMIVACGLTMPGSRCGTGFSPRIEATAMKCSTSVPIAPSRSTTRTRRSRSDRRWSPGGRAGHPRLRVRRRRVGRRCKIIGVRAATVHDTYTAHQGVEHDGVNVLCLGGRVISSEVAAEIVVTFLAEQFNDEERHVRRRAKVAEIERTGGLE